MTYNSFLFILVFLPAFIVLYFISSKFGSPFSKLAIIIAGIVFYLYGGLESAAVLFVSIMINLILTILISKISNEKVRKTFLVLAIILNVALLVYYKYFNFIAETLSPFLPEPIKTKNLILPLGISFFTFQQIMYVVSVWKRKIAKPDIPDYLAYVLYFPKIIMGPLIEPVDFINQLNDAENKTVHSAAVASGIKMFSIGLFKKMVIADSFAKAVDWGFKTDLSAVSSGDLFLVMLFYTFQIYFDFSGYSDMAVGVSKMINITLPMNFDSPYKALSIRSFWNRWHMSLTGFLTNYIYIPLGGSQNGLFRTCINTMIVFLVSGIWHGANRTFILWGCIHGMLQVTERIFDRAISKIFRAVRWGYTFLAVNLLWLLFRADSIDQWRNMLGAMFRFQNMDVSRELMDLFVLPETEFIFDKLFLVRINQNVKGFSMIIFTVTALMLSVIPESAYRRMNKLTWFNMLLCAAAFIWGVLCLSSESVFIYSGF